MGRLFGLVEIARFKYVSGESVSWTLPERVQSPAKRQRLPFRRSFRGIRIILKVGVPELLPLPSHAARFRGNAFGGRRAW